MLSTIIYEEPKKFTITSVLIQLYFTAMGEIAFPEGNLMPELSFGTHFFLDLVETNIFYAALFPDKKNVMFNKALLSSEENMLSLISPESAKYDNVIGVYDMELKIMSDVISQQVVCFAE